MPTSEPRAQLGLASHESRLHESTPANEPVLEVTNLTVGYGRSIIVRDASLSVRRGEIAVIVGPNGSGKSTLLKGVIGILRPSSGTVRLLEAAPRT